MGHEIIAFAGGHERFNDFDLWTLRHFFVTEAKAVLADEMTADAIAAVRFFEKWVWLGPGVIAGIDLDAFVLRSDARVALLLSIFERAQKKILSFGSTIPLEYLQAHVNSPAAYFTVSPLVDSFCRDIDRLTALLKKEPNQAPEPTAPSGRGSS